MSRKLFLLTAATAAYVLAAWVARPGFYEGFANPNPYNWASPPSVLAAGNHRPAGVQQILTTSDLTREARVVTKDAQASVYFGAGTLKPAAEASTVTVRIQPVTNPPPLGQLVAETNVYKISVDGTVSTPTRVELTYSNQVPSPSTMYAQLDGTTSWQALNTQADVINYQLIANARLSGYFVGAILASEFGHGPGHHSAGEALPWIVASLVLVAIAGVPLIGIRRKAAAR